ncbi:tRNA 5-methylaminomethyl-2-thiouridine biosynthesis bifunctional protein MnmC, partial [Vibrio parahaemolyticus V-223/04]
RRRYCQRGVSENVGSSWPKRHALLQRHSTSRRGIWQPSRCRLSSA